MGLLQLGGKEAAWWAIAHRVARIGHNLATKPPAQTLNTFDLLILLLTVIVSP